MATTITTFKKSQLGVEDIHFDSAGSASTANTPTSNGGTRQVRKLNASHVPTTTATRAKTNAAGTTLTETSVDATLQQLLDDNAAQGIPDGTTLQMVGGVLSVLSVPNSALETDSVNTTQIVNDAVTSDKLATDSVTADAIATGAVAAGEIATDAVIEAKIQDGAVTNGKILNGTIKAEKMADAPSHYVTIEETTSSTTGSADVIFATTTTVNSADMLFLTVKSFGGSNTYFTGKVIQSGANAVTATFDQDQVSGSTTVQLMIMKAVTP